MDKNTLIQMIEGYLSWIEQMEAKLKIQGDEIKRVGTLIDIATNNLRSALAQLKALP